MADRDDDDLGDDVVDGVRHVRQHPAGRAAARTGLASRALIYGTLAVLTAKLAFGRQRGDADQAGALQALGSTPAGVGVLWVLVAGVVAYVLWRGAQVIAPPVTDTSTKDRVKNGLEGLAYVPIAALAVTVASGDRRAAVQGDRYRSLSAAVMQDWPAGRWWVGAVGVVVLGVGLYLASEGPRRSFREDLVFRGRRAAERTVVTLGVAGCTARGLVFALAGLLIVSAAVTDDPDRAGGVDAALRSVVDEPWGPTLLVVVALGLAAYAAFAVGEAIYRRV